MPKPKGFTVVEMVVTLTIMVILAAYSLPKFQTAQEESRVDMAAASLGSIWTAERMYWSSNNTFTGNLSDLQTAGFLDPSFIANISASGAPFAYTIPAANSVSFTALATRANSSRWSGAISINEQGALSGSISGAGGIIVTPAVVQ